MGLPTGDYKVEIGDGIIYLENLKTQEKGQMEYSKLTAEEAKRFYTPNANQSPWYPGPNKWENKGLYKIKYKLDPQSTFHVTDILMAKSSLSDKQAEKEHIHIFKVGESGQGAVFKDSSGKFYKLSDYDIKMILDGHRPLW
jgi:hypothetical protein